MEYHRYGKFVKRSEGIDSTGMSKETGWRPDKVGLFAGAIKYSQYGSLTRFLFKLVAAVTAEDTNTSRDYEYTDWNKVEGFAADFGASVVP